MIQRGRFFFFFFFFFSSLICSQKYESSLRSTNFLYKRYGTRVSQRGDVMMAWLAWSLGEGLETRLLASRRTFVDKSLPS
jgi:hypothetical protein